MRKIYAIVALLYSATQLNAQTYLHPTVGQQNTYTGTCMVNTNSGTYYDNGGPAGNYSPNINGILRTFCPSTPGTAVRVTFTSFSMNDNWAGCGGPSNCCDWLIICNGPTQNSPVIWQGCLSSPGTVTSTHPSGCLTFRFVSDNTVQLAGWSATISNVPMAGGPTGLTNADCINATGICNNGFSFSGLSTGPGLQSDGCTGCVTSENFSNWYEFTINTSGTLGFTLNPNSGTHDYDFALYLASSCGSLGSPVRCSYAATTGATGMANWPADVSEDVYGDGWVQWLNVTAGQHYYLLINEWSPNNGSFTLNWSGTATIQTPIPDFMIGPLTYPSGSSYTICQNQPLTLTASGAGGSTFTWWNAPTGGTQIGSGTTFAVPTGTAGTFQYYLQEQTASGCTSARSVITITVNPTPNVSISSNSPVCSGSTINLSSSGGGTYSWSGPNGFSSTLQNPTIPGATAANAGTYSVIVTAAGCTNSASTNVTVNPTPTVSVNSATICSGQTATLTASPSIGGGTYSWSPGGFTTQSINVSPSSTTTYTVVYTVAGCTGTGSGTVTVNPLPNATANATPSTICSGQNINLSASGGTSYSWTGPNGFTSTLQNPVISNATVAASGTYTVTVTSAAGCQNTAQVTVTVNASPTASASVTPSTICAGQNVSFSSSGGVSYSWSGPNGFSSTLQNPGLTNATTAASGTYTVVVTAANGCTANATANLTVNALPNATANATPAVVCAGQNVNLSASGGTSYSWTGPNGFSSTLQNPTLNNVSAANAGTYTVTVTGANGCQNTAQTTVTVNSLPSGTVSNNGPVCTGSTLNLTASGGVSYSWTGPNGFSSTLQNPSISSVTLANGGVYSVTITGSNGCSITLTTNAQVVTNPGVSISANPSSSICIGQSVTLTATSGSGYSWSTGQSTNPITVSPTVNTSYTVTVTNPGGCVGTANASINITVNSLPNASANSNSPVCEGQTLNLNAGGGSTYSWTGPNSYSSNQQNNTISNVTVAASGNYIVTVTDANGCQNTANVNVTINSAPANPTVSATSTTICQGQSTTINATGSGASVFNIYDASIGGTLLGAVPLSVSPTSTTTYYVEAVSSNGCANLGGRIPVQITVIPLANPSWTSPGTVCESTGNINLDALVTGTPGGTWTGTNVSGSNFNTTGLAGQTISITYTVGTNPCQQTSTQTIQVIGNADASWTAPAAICESDGLINLNPLVTGTNGGSWSGTGVSGNTFDPSGLSGQTIPVTYTVGTPPCSASQINNITINPTPDAPSVTASANAICAGESVVINASGTGATSFEVYAASTGGTALGLTPYVVSPNTTTTYYVQSVSAQGCTNVGGRVPVTITVNPLPNVDAGPNQTICPGTSTTLMATGANTYVWSTSDNTPVISVTPINLVNVYYVTGTGAGGCTAIDSVIVTINSAALTLDAVDDSTSMENIPSTSVTVSVTDNDNGNFNSVSIIGGPQNGTASVSGTNIIYTPSSGFVGNDTIIYVVCDALCNTYCDTARLFIIVNEEVVVVIPDGFSPNGDGINDEFVILGIEKYPENELYIYNRWGGLVYSAKPYQNNWKGESNTTTLKLVGDEVVDGTYFYILKLNAEEKGKNGYIELRRK
jgi:gliding motility-associated-like protein